MAAYDVNAYGAQVKVREVWVVILLSFVTFGIYTAVWYYMINRELRDFGRAYQDPELSNENPTLSVLAITLGALILVPAIVSFYKTVGRIRRAQRIVGVRDLTNGWIIVAFYAGGFIIPFLGLASPGYVQDGLNSMWKRYPALEPGAGPQAQVAAPQQYTQQPQYAQQPQQPQQPAQSPQPPQYQPPVDAPPPAYGQPPAQQPGPPQAPPAEGDQTQAARQPQPPPPPIQKPPPQQS